MSTPTPLDRAIVIVGGGLAGCTLAAALARAGLSATLLERHADVPDVLRGELIMPAAVDVLDALDLGDVLRAVAAETEGVVLHHSAFAGGAFSVEYEAAPPPLSADLDRWRPRGLCGLRRDLYRALADATLARPGVERIAPFEVVDIERLDDGRLLLKPRDPQQAPVRAELVVAADGAHSRCRRAMGILPARDDQPSWVQGFVALARQDHGLRQVHVAECEQGAVFVFPFPGRALRFTFEYHDIHRDEVRAVADPVRYHLELVRRAMPEVWAQIDGDSLDPVGAVAVQPARDTLVRGLVEDRFALMGDAAGCLDPFTGYGMTLAILDADDLARTLIEAQGDFAVRRLRPYEARRHAREAIRRQSTDYMAYIFLDKAEGFAPLLAERLAARWSDREMMLPLVATEFAGYDPVVPASVGLRSHALGQI